MFGVSRNDDSLVFSAVIVVSKHLANPFLNSCAILIEHVCLTNRYARIIGAYASKMDDCRKTERQVAEGQTARLQKRYWKRPLVENEQRKEWT